jgi:hypothetical protein
MTHNEFFVWLSGFLSAVENNAHFEAIKRQMAEVQDPKFIISSIPKQSFLEETIPVPVENIVVEDIPIAPPTEAVPVVQQKRKSPFAPIEPDTANNARQEQSKPAPAAHHDRLLFRI